MTSSLALSAAVPSRTSLAVVSHDVKDPPAAIEVALDFALEQGWAGDAASGGATAATQSLVRPGLPDDALRHLFRRFWQAPETAHLGTGAGLLIVRMLVEDEGGTVGVRSAAGCGAEFWMALPARAS